MKLISIFYAILSGSVILGRADDTTPADITLYFYSLQNPEFPIIITVEDASKINRTHFCGWKDTIILIHEYGDSGNGLLVTTVKNQIVKAQRDLNIIGLDWSPLWKDKTKSIAKAAGFIAAFLNSLTNYYGLKYSQLTIVGHSIGGLVSAAIGSELKGQVQNIVGLDTVGISKTDAKFVEYIHTTSLSTTEAEGHVDYFPNGGSNQAGCSDFFCNHWRAIDYYAESISSNKFIATKCDSYQKYKQNTCKDNHKSSLGTLELDYNARGKYYLDTNDQPPFAKG